MKKISFDEISYPMARCFACDYKKEPATIHHVASPFFVPQSHQKGEDVTAYTAVQFFGRQLISPASIKLLVWFKRT